MRCESLTFSRVKHHHFVRTIMAENRGPIFLDAGIEPHELVLASSFYFPVVFSIEELELILECLGWCLASNKDDTEGALSTEADILRTPVV